MLFHLELSIAVGVAKRHDAAHIAHSTKRQVHIAVGCDH
jgi:hypothetical protein